MSDQTTPAPDPRVIERAEAVMEAAAAAAVNAEAKAAATADALADAADAVSVAETKVEDFQSAEGKLPWQVAAAGQTWPRNSVRTLELRAVTRGPPGRPRPRGRSWPRRAPSWRGRA